MVKNSAFFFNFKVGQTIACSCAVGNENKSKKKYMLHERRGKLLEQYPWVADSIWVKHETIKDRPLLEDGSVIRNNRKDQGQGHR